MKFKHGALAAALLVLGLSAACAADDAARLGADLTPLGGEKAGNKDGTIPAWTGTEAPQSGWAEGKVRGEFWKHKGEKPLFAINAADAAKYADKLTPGQAALFKELKGYRMDVYPSHRTCGAPDFVYENTKKNVTAGQLAPSGWSVKDAYVPGVPFPFPKNGAEVMLNAKFRYRGLAAWWRPVITAASPRPGSNDWIDASDEVFLYWPWAKKGSTLLSKIEPVEQYTYFTYTQPAALAGQSITVTQPTNEPGNTTFYYFPGQRRVRRMPAYSYDSPQIGFENQYTMDEPMMFMGTMDRFDWKLVGKKEIYVPYDVFGAYNAKGKFHDFAQRNFINPDDQRYELHRVWVVEATVKAGMRHSAPKRMFYIDEDSWNMLVAEDYDAQGKLWKVRQGFPIPVYETHSCDVEGFVQYNLASGRYVVDMHDYGVGTELKYFTEPDGPRFHADFYTAQNLQAISER